MLAAEHAKVVDAAWRHLWSSGITNPITVSDIMGTALLAANSKVDYAHSLMNLGAQGVADRVKGIRADHGILNGAEVEAVEFWALPRLFEETVRSLSGLVGEHNGDLLGDAYEHVLSKLSTAGHFGQFRTPRHVIDFMVEVLSPASHEQVLDPACGSGGFLVSAGRAMGSGESGHLHGWEIDRTIARIAMSNAVFHGLPATSVEVRDGLTGLDGLADVVLANPPFSGDVSAESAARFMSGSRRSEVLFVEAIARLLKPQGRAAVIVPIGVLDGRSSSGVLMRSQLLEQHNVWAVVELPSAVFKPYADVRTGIIFIDDAKPQDGVLMARVEHDGFSQNAKRVPQPSEDCLPLALRLLQGDRESLAHAHISRADLLEADCNLSPSRWVRASRHIRSVPALATGVKQLSADVQELIEISGKISKLVGQ